MARSESLPALLLSAAVVAVATSGGLWPVRPADDRVMAIVALRDLNPGVTITEHDLYAVAIAPRYLPDGVFLSPEHVVGRVPRERVLANELVRVDRLADPERSVGMNTAVPPGMRAVSVSLRSDPGLASRLSPGSWVDVLGEGADGGDRVSSRPLKVLGVHPASAGRANPWPAVSVLVDATGAEHVAQILTRDVVQVHPSLVGCVDPIGPLP